MKLGIAVRLLLAGVVLASLPSFADNSKSTYDFRGPRNYHATYGSIFNTVVVIQGFRLRTNDGKVIYVRNPRMNVDLQDVKAFRRGILVDLRKVIPAGQFVDVVEIQANTVDCSNHYVNFNTQNQQFGKQCKLRVPKSINFYTTTAPVQMGSFEYLVKVDFNPLNAIQLDLATITTHKQSCWYPFPDSPEVCSPAGRPQISYGKKCELINPRQPIMNIVRAIDEA